MLKKHSSGYLDKLESILFIEPSFHENGPLLGLPFVMTILSNAISLIYFQWIHYCSTFYTLKHTISPTHLLVHSPNVCSLMYSIYKKNSKHCNFVQLTSRNIDRSEQLKWFEFNVGCAFWIESVDAIADSVGSVRFGLIRFKFSFGCVYSGCIWNARKISIRIGFQFGFMLLVANNILCLYQKIMSLFMAYMLHPCDMHTCAQILARNYTTFADYFR